MATATQERVTIVDTPSFTTTVPLLQGGQTSMHVLHIQCTADSYTLVGHKLLGSAELDEDFRAPFSRWADTHPIMPAGLLDIVLRTVRELAG